MRENLGCGYEKLLLLSLAFLSLRFQVCLCMTFEFGKSRLPLLMLVFGKKSSKVRKTVQYSLYEGSDFFIQSDDPADLAKPWNSPTSDSRSTPLPVGHRQYCTILKIASANHQDFCELQAIKLAEFCKTLYSGAHETANTVSGIDHWNGFLKSAQVQCLL